MYEIFKTGFLYELEIFISAAKNLISALPNWLYRLISILNCNNFELKGINSL